jgi:hypothetical protein
MPSSILSNIGENMRFRLWLLFAVVCNIPFWVGVVVDAAYLAPPALVKYGEWASVASLHAAVQRLSLRQVFMHTPPVLAVLLASSSVATLFLLHRYRRTISEAAPSLAVEWLLLGLPGAHGVFVAAFMVVNVLDYGALGRESLSEDWLPRAAFGLWYVFLSALFFKSIWSRARLVDEHTDAQGVV